MATPAPWALIIGINSYPLLNSLQGCVNDANLMYQTLTSSPYNFPKDNVILITDQTATKPTQAAICQAMVDLANNPRLEQDAVVVVYYAGHGSQVQDAEGDEGDGLDETIVPSDSMRSKTPPYNRDITDDQIGAFIKKLSERTQYLTLIFDSCHSGNISRDIGLEPPHADERFVPADPDHAPEMPPVSPQGLWGAPVTAPSRDLSAGGWLPLSEGYVLLSGCRSDQTSKERPFTQDGQTQRHGVLTWFMTRTLQNAAPDLTYWDLWQAILKTLQQQGMADQTPTLEGAYERLVFQTDFAARNRYVQLVAQPRRGALGEALPPTLGLSVGKLHLVSPGSVFAVYPLGTQPQAPNAQPVAKVRVTQVSALSAQVEVVEGNAAQLVNGMPAVEVEHVGERLPVAIGGAGEPWATLQAQAQASPRLQLVDTGVAQARVALGADVPAAAGVQEADADKLVVVTADNLLVGGPLPATPDSASEIVNRLEKIARYQAVDSLAIPNPTSGLDAVTLEVRRLPAGWTTDRLPGAADGNVVAAGTALSPNDMISLVIRNPTQQTVYASVLALSRPDYTVDVVFPPPGSQGEIQAGKSAVDGPFPNTSAGRGDDTLLLVVTTQPVDLRSLASRDIGDLLGEGNPLSALLGEAMVGAMRGWTRPAVQAAPEFLAKGIRLQRG